MKTVLKFEDWRNRKAETKKEYLFNTVVRKANEIIKYQKGHTTDATFYKEFAAFFNERQLEIAEERLDEMMSYELVWEVL